MLDLLRGMVKMRWAKDPKPWEKGDDTAIINFKVPYDLMSGKDKIRWTHR